MQTTTTAPTQGIMTTEVGAITGEVVISTTGNPEGVAVTVAYEGAKDTYTVEGSPARAGTQHAEVIAALTEDTGKATRLD